MEKAIIMFLHQKRKFRYLLPVAIFLIVLSFTSLSADNNRRSNDGNIEGWVSSINQEVLYIDGQEYKLSENTRVFINSENGWEITLKTITDVGYINKAKVHVDKGLVQKIVILEVQQ
jgi:hypothetical protein